MSYVLHFCYNVFFEPFIKIVLGTDSRGAGRSFFEYVLQFVVYHTCPPSGVAILYNNIKSPKKIRWFQGSTHGYVPPNPQIIEQTGR